MGAYPREMKASVHVKTRTRMPTAAPLTTAPGWEAGPSGSGGCCSDATTQGRTAPQRGLGQAPRGSRGMRKSISGGPGPASSRRDLGGAAWAPYCSEPHAGTQHAGTRTHDPTSAKAAQKPGSCRGYWARHHVRMRTPGDRGAGTPLQDTSLQLPVDLQPLQNKKGRES